MDNIWVSVVVPLIIAIIVNAGGLLLYRSRRGKNKADAAESLTGSALDMVKRWEVRVVELEAQVDAQGMEIHALESRVRVLENENADLRHGAGRLEGQLKSLGHEPVWCAGMAKARP